MLHEIERYYSFVLRALLAVSAIYLGLMMAAIVYFTSFRGLGIPYSGHSFIFIEYGFLYMMMLGSPWLVRTRGHVYIELVTAAMPDEYRPALSRLVAFLCFVICAVLAWYSGAVAVDDYLTGELDVRGSTDIPRWIATSVMPLGFGLMAVEFLRFAVGAEIMHTGEAGVHE